jgi:hypothetical protein
MCKATSKYLIVALFLALGLPGTNARAQDDSPVDGDGTNSVVDSKVTSAEGWLRINAFTDVPTSGRLLSEEYAATNRQGVYPARMKRFPRNFRVTITSDRDQEEALNSAFPDVYKLSADVRNFDPTYGVVYIDPATTLVSRLLERKPSLSFRQAEAQVRKFLSLPVNASLGAALREDKYFHSQFFSEQAFLQQALPYGGVDNFLDCLVDEMAANSGQVHPFSSSRQAIPPVLAFMRTNLGSAAFHWVFGEGVGWVLQSTGLSVPGATPDAIERLQKGLADLQSSVDELSRQLQALTQQVLARLTQTQYNQIVVPAVALAAQVNGVESNVAFYAQGCPPLPEDSDISAAPHFSDFCRDQKVTIAAQLNDVQINHSFETLSAYLLDNQTAGFKGMLHLYSQALGESVPFFRPADSTKIQNMFDYWDGVQIQGANLKVELLHLNGAQNNPGGIAQLKSFLGDEDADPPTKGAFGTTRDRELTLIFPAVPAGTVINTKDRTMWPTNYPDPALPQICAYPLPPPYGNKYIAPVASVNLNGRSNWRSPTTTEVQALIAGKTGASPIAWLVEQTKAVAPDFPLSAGFPDITKFPPLQCYENHMFTGWTSTSTGEWRWYLNHSGRVYDIFRLDNGVISNERFHSWAGFGINYSSNWTYLTRQLSAGEQYYWYP